MEPEWNAAGFGNAFNLGLGFYFHLCFSLSICLFFYPSQFQIPGDETDWPSLSGPSLTVKARGGRVTWHTVAVRAVETKEAFSGKEGSSDDGVSPVGRGGSNLSQGQWGGKHVQLSVLKQNGRCTSSLAKIAKSVQEQPNNCFQPYGCFPTEDDKRS